MTMQYEARYEVIQIMLYNVFGPKDQLGFRDAFSRTSLYIDLMAQ